MTMRRRILLAWVSFLPLGIVAALYHAGTVPIVLADTANCLSRVLVGVISFYLFKYESTKAAKAIFVNFFLFFGAQAILHSIYIILRAKLLSWDPYAGVYYFQYAFALYFLLLLVCVVYMTFESVVARFKVYQKYSLTLLVAGGVCGYVFYPYFENPKYRYTTSDIRDYRAIDNALQQLQSQGRDNPSVAEIAKIVRLQDGYENHAIRESTGHRTEKRIAELLPYLKGLNYNCLIMKPLYIDSLYMSLVSTFFIAFFVAYHFFRDPPKPAYFEKIGLLLLLYCCFEALHMYAFSKSVRVEDLAAITVIGQYLSVSITLLLFWLFSVRLKFILSPEGKFYERHVLTDSDHITRWRDAIDRWIIRKFLDPGILERRFLVQRKKGL